MSGIDILQPLSTELHLINQTFLSFQREMPPLCGYLRPHLFTFPINQSFPHACVCQRHLAWVAGRPRSLSESGRQRRGSENLHFQHMARSLLMPLVRGHTLRDNVSIRAGDSKLDKLFPHTVKKNHHLNKFHYKMVLLWL